MRDMREGREGRGGGESEVDFLITDGDARRDAAACVRHQVNVLATLLTVT